MIWIMPAQYQDRRARYSPSRTPSSASIPGERLLRIVPALRILERLEVGEHLDVRQLLADLVLEPLDEIVARLHAERARHQHVDVHEALGAGHARAQRVVVAAFVAQRLQNADND